MTPSVTLEARTLKSALIPSALSRAAIVACLAAQPLDTQFLCRALLLCATKIYPDLVHRLDHFRMDQSCGISLTIPSLRWALLLQSDSEHRRITFSLRV
jgi:hypothetical protein